MTNLEKIKSDIQNMPAKELATKFYSLFTCEQCKNYDCEEGCLRGYVKWLESEVEKNE